MVDMYAKDESGRIRKDTETGLPETHTVTLFSGTNDNIVLLDPSNTTFTEYLQPLLQQLSQEKGIGKNVITIDVPGDKIYQVANPKFGRDCISVALAAANEINAGTNIEPPDIIRKIGNVPKAIAPDFTKREAAAAKTIITQLPGQIALGQHSTDPTIRKASTEEIQTRVQAMRQGSALSSTEHPAGNDGTPDTRAKKQTKAL